MGNREAFADTFERWCDNAESGASCSDHVRLAEALDALGRADAARERVDHALEVDAGHRPAWDMAAQLHERAGDLMGAANALCGAAELCNDDERLRAIDPSRGTVRGFVNSTLAAERIRAALRRDPAAADGNAHLARLAYELGEFPGSRVGCDTDTRSGIRRETD